MADSTKGVDNDDDTETLKIILLGDSGVGKTSILKKYFDGHFSTSTLVTTIGIDYRVKIFSVNGKEVKVTLWDTSGQERFRSLGLMYCRRADGVVFMYDVTDYNSFDSITNYWIDQSKEYVPENVEYMLVGTKIDLPRVVLREEGVEAARELGMPFFETSPNLPNHEEIFGEALLLLVENILAKKAANPIRRDSTIISNLAEKSPGTKKKCCSISSS